MSRKELARAGLGKAALDRRITNRPGVAAAQLAIRRGGPSCATETVDSHRRVACRSISAPRLQTSRRPTRGLTT